jgi:hypothetical protein
LIQTMPALALSSEATGYDEGLEQRGLKVRYLVPRKAPAAAEICSDLVARAHR